MDDFVTNWTNMNIFQKVKAVFFNIILAFLYFFAQYSELLVFPFIIFSVVYQRVYINSIADKEQKEEKRQQFLHTILLFVAVLMTVVFLKLPFLLKENNEKLLKTVEDSKELLKKVSNTWDANMREGGQVIGSKVSELVNNFYKNFDNTMLQLNKTAASQALFGKYDPPTRAKTDFDHPFFNNRQIVGGGL
tara:strand:+ start:2988 stop:3560 length:573 start_codon:yes stop_codon:yes gene_type:complete